MSDYPKYFTKGDETKVANNASRAVELRFAGYKEVVKEGVSNAAPRTLPRNDLAMRALETGAEFVDTTTDEK